MTFSSGIRALPNLVALAALALGTACSGSPDAEPATCGDTPLPPCPPWGQPVSLDVVRASPPYPEFPPYPGNRAALFAGDEVEVTLYGFEPGRQVQVFSTYGAIHLLRYWPDDHGTVRFPLVLRARATVSEEHFVVVQPANGDADPLLASFIVAVLPETVGHSMDSDVVFEALSVVGVFDEQVR